VKFYSSLSPEDDGILHQVPSHRLRATTNAKSLPGMRVFTLAAALVLVLSGRAHAWGYEAHRVVAEIAEQYLAPETERQIRELLALENATTLAEVSTWADEIRPQRPQTAPWHFVDIPIHPPAGTPEGYDPARDCQRRDCVVAKIGDMAAVLRDKTAAQRERLEALKFLVHFVADVHQPLHAADDFDRGGTDVHVEFMGRRTNLHAVWDSGVLAAAGISDERAYALDLARSISPGELGEWSADTPADWANESYGVASHLIYGEWPHAPGPLPASYEQAAIYVVNVQLQKAGVRLAAALNDALR
jgi:nuclease S1